MKRKQALLLYLVGTLGQILLVSLLVWLLRAGGVRVDYGTPIGPVSYTHLTLPTILRV